MNQTPGCAPATATVHARDRDLPIAESQRKFRWPLGRRPDDHAGLSTLEL